MPEMMMKDTEMDDAFYSTPEAEVEATGETTEETPESIDEEAAENPTALLPISALGANVKAGDTVTIRVVKVYGDEAEVEISSGKTPTEETQSADDELDAMEKV